VLSIRVGLAQYPAAQRGPVETPLRVLTITGARPNRSDAAGPTGARVPFGHGYSRGTGGATCVFFVLGEDVDATLVARRLRPRVVTNASTKERASSTLHPAADADQLSVVVLTASDAVSTLHAARSGRRAPCGATAHVAGAADHDPRCGIRDGLSARQCKNAG